jgi:hypothetical protein
MTVGGGEGKITRGWRTMQEDQEADDTKRGGVGRQCVTIDAIAYDVTYIATIGCDAATFLMRSHAMRMQHISSSLSRTSSTIMRGRHGADLMFKLMY